MLVAPASAVASLPGPIAVLGSVIRSKGVSGLWLGHAGTLIRETGGTAAWFTTKEFIADLLVARRVAKNEGELLVVTSSGNVQLLLWESALSGACAGAAFNLALFPADSVKSAMQTEEELRPRKSVSGAKPTSKATFLGTAKAMYKAQGVRGLYAGCGITVVRSIPSSAIIFVIYDGLCRVFGS